ncbi:MAG: fimbria major subunit [Tannerellaceae bacterium]|nr:fimbria major subunit [Tannerellaceae bacterium]
MKKYFKFLTVAAILAAGMIGCSSEAPVNKDEVTPPGTDPNNVGKETYATFRFESDGPATRATNLYPSATEVTTATSYRLTIYNAAVKEIDTVFPAGLPLPAAMTVKLQSGTKQIYVIQSALGTPPTAGSPISATNKGSGWHEGITDATTPAILNTTAFSLATAGGNVDNIQTLYDPQFVLSNRTDSTQFTLTAGISENDSKTPGNSNNINIRVRRALAKVQIGQATQSGPGAPAGKIITHDSTGVITTSPMPTYRMLNILNEVYPFQHVVSGQVITPYKNYVHVPPAVENHVARGTVVAPGASLFFPLADTIGIGTGGSGATDVVVGSTTAYYLTENTSVQKRTATFAAIKAQFVPTKNHYLTDTKYNSAGDGSFYDQVIATADATPGVTFYYLKRDITKPLYMDKGTIVAGSSATASLQLAQKIAFHLKFPGQSEKASLADYNDAAVTSANGGTPITNGILGITADYFSEYTNGICYYRLDMGEYHVDATGNVTGKYGLERNKHYSMTIDGYLTLGSNRVADLIGTGVLTGETFLTVVVEIVGWEPASGGGTI